MKTGDVLLFKGEGLFSTLVMAPPDAEYSHVGLYVNHSGYGPCVFESTSIGNLCDIITGEKADGVQLTVLGDRIESYKGEVFHLPIVGPRTLAQHQAIYNFIDEHHGTPYEEDNLQLIRAELDVFPWQRNKPDASSLFCSETVVMCLREAKIVQDSEVSPNEFTPTDCADLPLKIGFSLGDIKPLK